MPKAYILDKSQNLIEFLSDLIVNHNLENTTVIFPNRRPTLFLAKSLANKKHTALDSIELFSIDDFVDYIYKNTSNVIYPKISSLEGVFLLFDINKKIRMIDINSIDQFWSWGYKFFSDFEELYLEQVDVKTIDYLIQNNLPNDLLNFPQRISKFSQMYSEFYSLIEEKGFTTRSVRYKIASTSQEYKENIIFAGFYDLTRTEQALFANMLNVQNGFFVSKKGPKIKDLLKKLQMKDIEESENSKKSVSYHFIKGLYLHNEVLKLKELKNSINGFRDDDLIVLSSEVYLFPIIHQCLDPKTDTFNISIGYPLSRTPIVSLFEALLSLHKNKQGEIYLKDYLSVMLHPYIKSLSLNDKDFIVRIFAYTVKEHFSNTSISIVSLADLESDELTTKTIEKLKLAGFEVSHRELNDFLKLIHKYIITSFLDIKNIGDFLNKVIDFIGFLQESSSVKLHPIESKYIEGVLQNLLELSSLSIKDYKLDNIVSYFNLLKNFIQTKHIAFPSEPMKGFQVLGNLETRNLTFKRIFYLGANEGIIPTSHKQDTILTDDIRKFLGLSTSKDRLDMQKYNFFNLIQSACEVYFFYRTSEDRSKSRFLESIFWDIQRQEKSLDVPKEEDAIFQVTFAQSKPFDIENTQKVKHILNNDNFYFTPSNIDDFLYCKAKFYFSSILGLRPLIDNSEELVPTKVGELMHKLLKEYFDSFKNKLYKPKNIEVELETLCYIMDKQNPKPSKTIWLQIQQIKYAIKRFFGRNTIEERLIVDLEHTIQTQISIGDIQVKLKGRLDRLDRLNNNTFVIVDYKTGNLKKIDTDFLPTPDNRPDWLKKIESFQMPIYSLLVSKKYNTDNLIFEFWSFKDSQIKTYQVNNELLEAYEKALKIIIEEIYSCDYFEYTQENIKEMCAHCPYKIICARHFITKNW